VIEVKILIAVDMEGISGVTNWDQVNQDHPEYTRFRAIMTDDVNAAIAGAIEGGASEVLVTDGHGSGSNILIESLDPRAKLNTGNASPFAMVQGIESGDFHGVFFVGYHARSDSQNGILAHTWSNRRVARFWLNDVEMGEYGLNAALCGHFESPVVLITGDQIACAQAVALLGDLETVEVKQASSFSSAECLPPIIAQGMIRSAAAIAVSRLTTGTAPPPYKVAKPVRGVVKFRMSEMADNASFLPGSVRLDGTRIEFTSADMPTAYKTFRAAIGLA
jgi:D-amino peptidase